MKINKQNRREFLQIGAAGLTALTFLNKTNAANASEYAD